MAQIEHKFLFSVIMPIYNVEEYIEDAILSVVNQTIGFDKIQLILINDGSPDNSEDICLKYKEKYPDNIVYQKIPNGGVSNARNTGFQYVDAKYITFLDPDDKWEKSSFENAYKFFEEHYDEIDVLGARIQFFEATDDFHPLDYKFDKGSRVIDITDDDEVFSVQSTAATTFIKSTALGDNRFDKRLKYGEDSTFINRMILEKKAYGIVAEAVYRYRRRSSSDSAVNTQRDDKAFYTDSLVYYHMALMKESYDKYGEILPFIQSIVAYDLYWRIGWNKYKNVLTEEEQKEYLERTRQLWSKIDDRIILKHPRHKSIQKKVEAYYFKHQTDLLKDITFNKEEATLYCGKVPMLRISRTKGKACRISFLEIKDNKLCIDGLIGKWLFGCTFNGKVTFKLKFGNQEIEPELLYHDPNNSDEKIGNGSGGSYYYRYYCEFDLSSVDEKGTNLVPYICFGDEEVPFAINYSKFVPNTNEFKPEYKVFGKYIVKCYRKRIFVLKPKKDDFDKKISELENGCISWLEEKGRADIAKLRKDVLEFRRSESSKGEIWLVSDRIDNANDNGEVLFRYITTHKPKGVRPIFVIGKSAKPEVIERIKSEGEMIFFEDEKYPLYFLNASKVISSSAGEFTINPFGDDHWFVRDLFNFKYYYLQHGVACADLASWLNRFGKNINMFFTAGEKEQDSIINGRYLYTDKQVKLTGQSRFDDLYNDDKKQILILPTWRRSISESYDEKTSSVYFDGFKKTDYFKFYNSLINDERLLKVMREHGYTGLFCLHPIHMKQYVDYQANDVFSVNEGYIDYNAQFAKSSLMVTDYSSVLFDFAYLRKPVVYAHFDKEEFFENQIYDEGYFQYERDGFGPVCYDLDSTVDAIIAYVENDCKNQQKYVDRVNGFFKFDDKNNCKRILDAILDGDEKKSFFKKLFGL